MSFVEGSADGYESCIVDEGEGGFLLASVFGHVY
jgi:hypothetical protein